MHRMHQCMCVCVCACVCARARVCVFVWEQVKQHQRAGPRGEETPPHLLGLPFCAASICFFALSFWGLLGGSRCTSVDCDQLNTLQFHSTSPGLLTHPSAALGHTRCSPSKQIINQTGL